MNDKRPWDYWLLWFVALSSLALNVWLWNTWLVARRQVGQAAEIAAQSVAALRASSIDSTVKVQQNVPISITVPFSATVSVPLKLDLPVKTQVTVPLHTVLGTFNLNIPIETTVPVNVTPQVPIQTTLPISTTVPISLELPVHVSLADTQLGQSLLDLQTQLENASAALQSGPFAPKRNP